MARRDLDRLDDQYLLIDPDYADRILHACVAAAHYLADSPKVGATVNDGPRRKWRIPDTPYILLYRPVRDELRILRVRHGRSDWKK